MSNSNHQGTVATPETIRACMMTIGGAGSWKAAAFLLGTTFDTLKRVVTGQAVDRGTLALVEKNLPAARESAHRLFWKNRGFATPPIPLSDDQC